MAEADLRLLLRTVADDSGAKKTTAALRDVQQQAQKTNQQQEQMVVGLARQAAGYVSVAAAAAAATTVFTASITAQRENERVTRATAAAYGVNAQQFTRFAAALSQTTGFTSQAILEASLSARTLTANYGLTIEQTQNLIRASADLAKVRGIGVAEAFERVQSAIRGEAEASEYLGLTLNDTFIKNNALNGSVRTTFERMTDAQKAQIRYDELLRQTATFKGLATNSVNSLDGAMLRAESSANRLALAFGRIATPATIGLLERGAQAMKDIAIIGEAIQQGGLQTKLNTIGEALVGGTAQPSTLAARAAAERQNARLRALNDVSMQPPVGSLRELFTPGRAGATLRASEGRAGERNIQSLREIAFFDQRDAAVRDLLSAQRDELTLKEQITQMEKEHGDLTARRLQLELASINAQQRAFPAQRALQDTERAIERARLVLQIRGTSAAERSAARGTIRDLSRNVAPGQRLAAFDAETALLGSSRASQDFDLAARTSQIGTDQGIAHLVTLANVSAARTDEAQARLAEIMQKAIEDGFLKRPPQQITLQLLNAEGQVTYEELIEATDQAQMPPVIRVSGVRR